MNLLSLPVLHYLAIGLSGFTLLWLLIASIQFIRKQHQSAKTAAIIAGVFLLFLVIVMWDAHSQPKPPKYDLRGLF